jgi:hypothetical protein
MVRHPHGRGRCHVLVLCEHRSAVVLTSQVRAYISVTCYAYV